MKKDIIETIKMLAYRYLYAQENNKVWGRECSDSYRHAQGVFEGYLMAYNLTYELAPNVIVVYNEKNKIVCTINAED